MHFFLKNQTILKATLTEHFTAITELISFSNKRFALCLKNKSIKIWKTNRPIK